jgi:hypothetical protein
MKTKPVAALGRAVPELTTAYHRDNRAAPLPDVCLFPEEFRAHSR